MFTGLVGTVGTVLEIVSASQSKRLRIEASFDEQARALGASISVSGVCLTVTRATASYFEVEAAFETLACTSLRRLRVNSRVNLEAALCMGDSLGGHLVSGHVDGLGHLLRSEKIGEARKLCFAMPQEISRFVAEKGSICIDGVSLTVNEVQEESFCVGVIPHTLSVTTLGELQAGDPVNLEVDLIARYVARLLESSASAAATTSPQVTMESLASAGFLGRDKS